MAVEPSVTAGSAAPSAQAVPIIPELKGATGSSPGGPPGEASPGAGKGGDPGTLARVMRALRYRNYRLFFFGQGVSLIGSWMQRIALTWLVYRLTGSPFLLGLVGFAGQLPTFLLAPIAGVLVDRWPRRRLLVVTQTLAMVQAFILTALLATHTIAMWHVIVLSVMVALVNAFDMPARQAFVVEMIESREDLMNAIALNSSLVNGARLLGPSIAGVLIALLGETVCFFLNGVSFLAVIAALLAMRLRPEQSIGAGKQVLQGMKEGLVYAFGSVPVRAVLLLLGLVSLVGMPYAVLMPVFAGDILHGGPSTLGLLMASTGVGALIGTVYLAARPNPSGLPTIITVAAAVFGAGLVAFALSRNIWLSLPLLAMAGFGMMVQMSSSNTVLQTVVDDKMRGRLMSFYTMAFMGTGPFGSLLAGVGAEHLGAPATLVIGGVLCVVAAVAFSTKLGSVRHELQPEALARPRSAISPQPA